MSKIAHPHPIGHQSLIPWRPPLTEILDPRLAPLKCDPSFFCDLAVTFIVIGTFTMPLGVGTYFGRVWAKIS